MAITKARKEELVAQYVDLLENTNGFVVIQFGGMSVPQVDQLRNAVREAEGQYVVTKNTLLTKALQQTGWPVPGDLLTGPTAIAFGLNNFPGVAKAVLDSTKVFQEKIEVKGGVMGEDIMSGAQVKTISELPSLDELRSQLAGLVVAPAQGIVNVIQSANSQVVNVIQAYLDDNDAGGEEGAA